MLLGLCQYIYLLWLYVIFSVIAAFLTQTVTLDDATVKYEIWDTAGQGQFFFSFFFFEML